MHHIKLSEVMGSKHPATGEPTHHPPHMISSLLTHEPLHHVNPIPGMTDIKPSTHIRSSLQTKQRIHVHRLMDTTLH